LDRLIDPVECDPIVLIDWQFLLGPLVLFRLFLQRKLKLTSSHIVNRRDIGHIHETVDQFNDGAFDGFGLFVDLFL
jgi:hypothetical protein